MATRFDQKKDEQLWGVMDFNFILQAIEEAWVLYQWTHFESNYGPNKQNDGVGTDSRRHLNHLFFQSPPLKDPQINSSFSSPSNGDPPRLEYQVRF